MAVAGWKKKLKLCLVAKGLQGFLYILLEQHFFLGAVPLHDVQSTVLKHI